MAASIVTCSAAAEQNDVLPWSPTTRSPATTAAHHPSWVGMIMSPASTAAPEPFHHTRCAPLARSRG
ncbi:hypothetical protein [Streptomyces sp. CS147]|uniref:hypothetical protein n=1 Tax=Streptomyces sp. CS147 TaxID=2162715 RepID=UPI0013A556AD|nr:hypothetical protein [Streptomyces sp. CS147]